MTAASLARRLRLSPADLDGIERAVREAERRTDGEIAVAAIPRSDDYSFHELLASVILGLAASAAALLARDQVLVLLDRAFWHVEPWVPALVHGLVGFAVTALAFLFANVPAIDRLIVPRRVRRRAVRDRALRHFVESGVYATRNGTGILIFVSYLEREVHIVADRCVAAEVPQSEWDSLAAAVAAGIKAGKAADALRDAVLRAGDLLAARFPASRDNPNELSNALAILEANS